MTRQEALNILFTQTPAEQILANSETLEFFQFHVSCGGDTYTYRIYKKDGKIYEK